jgi:hypothetical protein
MNELEQKIETYLAQKPSKWSKMLQKSGLRPVIKLETAQTLISQYQAATTEKENNYQTEISGLNTQIQSLEGTIAEKTTNLNNLNARIELGVLLEGEEAEMYKLFKADMEKTKEITEKVSKQVYKTAQGAIEVAKSLKDYIKTNYFDKKDN